VKKNKSTLIKLWMIAGLSLAAGLLLTVHSVIGLPRVTERLARKVADARELADLRLQAGHYQTLLDTHSRYPARPTPFETLAQSTLPGAALSTRNTATLPSVPGWIAKKVSVDFTGITGDDLGRILEATGAAQPPWGLVEATLFASPTAGRVAKANLVMVSAERQEP
jgi:hypothetical protein